MNSIPTPKPGARSGKCPACGTALDRHVLSVQWPPAWPLLLSVKQVTAITNLSESTIYRREAKGTFPKRLLIGPSMTRWRLPEILTWTAHPETWRNGCAPGTTNNQDASDAGSIAKCRRRP